MSAGKVIYKCWFCETDITIVLEDGLVTSYEENMSGAAKSYKETYETKCSKCSTPTFFTFKQVRTGGLVKLDKKKGRN